MNNGYNYCQKIFVAEDNKELRDLIEEVLSDHYDTTLFENGKELLDHLKESGTKPDLYLLDIKMPVMDGIETAKHLREKDDITPIIAMSGYLNDAYYKGLFEQGFYEAVPKPFSIEVLLKKIENALNHALIPSYKRLIDIFTTTMAYMGDARDTPTQKHNIRIGEICYLLGQELSFSSKMCDDLRLGSRLHDIGKISIIDEVLQKAGKLTNKEYKYMQTHTVKGASILDGLASESRFNYLDLASAIALNHHEKLNGNGYPNGSKGEEIPFFVRIVSVVDIYDAVTMKRSYHESQPHEVGMKVLLDGKERGELDKDAIAAFIKREKDIIEIKNIYS